MANTVVIGVVFVDVKGFPFQKYDPQGRNLGTVKIVHGGVSRNVAENFANVGMPVSFVSMMEDSAIGRDVARHLSNAGVDLSHCAETGENGLGMWLVILDEQGNLAGSISRAPDMEVLENYVMLHAEEIIAGAENVVLEIDLNERIAAKALELAERCGKQVFSIVGNMSVILAHPEYLQRVACFICNEIEAGRLFGRDLTSATPEEMAAILPEEARSRGIRSMVVTMGAAGSVYFDGEHCGICPICPTEVVDTSGAGDAFFSGTVMGLTRGLPLEEAVHYGARLASMTIAGTENSCPVCPDFFHRQLSMFD